MTNLYVDESGYLSEFSDDEFGRREAFLRGRQQLTQEQELAVRRQRMVEEEYGGAGGVAATLGTSALAGASLGLSDVAIDALGYGDDVRLLREVNPGAAIAGELGGAVGASLLTGGTAGAATGAVRGGSLATRLARAVSAPTALVEAAGAGASRALGGRALGTVARGAMEGAAGGVGHGISRWAIYDEQLTPEMLATEALRGAGYGAALGGALSGLGAGGRRLTDVTQRGLDSLGDSALGGSTVVQRLLSMPIKGAKSLARARGASEVAEGIDDLMRRGSDGRLAAERALNADARLDELARDSAGSLQRLLDGVDVQDDVFRGAMKRKQVASQVKRGNEEDVLAVTTQQLDELTATTGRMQTLLEEAGEKVPKDLKRIASEVEALRRDMSGMAGRSDQNVDLFMRLDGLKRQIGQSARKWRKITDGRAAGNQRIGGRVFGELEGSYERLRSTLEADDVWGGIADAQRRVNEVWASDIQGEVSKFVRGFGEETQGAFGARGPRVANTDRVFGLFRALGDEGRAFQSSQMRSAVKQLRTRLETTRDALDLGPGEAQKLDDALEAVRKLDGALEEGAETARLRNVLRELDGAKPEFDPTAAAAFIGGVPGVAAARAYMGLSDPGRMIRHYARLQSFVGAQTEAVEQGVRRVVKDAVPAESTGSFAAAPLARAAPSIVTGDDDVQTQHQALRYAVEQPMDLEVPLSPLGMVAPGARQAAIQHAEQVQQYLRQMLPAPTFSAESLGLDSAELTSSVLLEDQLRRAAAVVDPAAVLSQLGTGDVSVEQIHAIRDTSPALYQATRDRVGQELASRRLDGQVLPYGQRIMIGVALDLPTDIMLEVGPAIQAHYDGSPGEEAALEEQTPPPPGRRRKVEVPDMAGDKRTPAESRTIAAEMTT